MKLARVVVIGCGGAGKSTFSRELSRRTGLPLIHLDELFWSPGWVRTPSAEWRERVQDLVRRERWILDGNYGGTLELRLAAADTVVFLDMPRWVCLLGMLERRFGRGTRSGAPVGCPERLDWEFMRWVWSYRRVHRPIILERLADLSPERRVCVLTSRAECRDFLERVGSVAT